MQMSNKLRSSAYLENNIAYRIAPFVLFHWNALSAICLSFRSRVENSVLVSTAHALSIPFYSRANFETVDQSAAYAKDRTFSIH